MVLGTKATPFSKPFGSFFFSHVQVTSGRIRNLPKICILVKP